MISYKEIPLTEVRVKKLVIDPETNAPVILIADLSESIILPIIIGSNEALSIATYMENVDSPRPMTHDLMNNILNEVHTPIRRVIITEIRDQTFFAVILLRYRGKELAIDSRPSDAIALAIRAEAPIFISTELLSSRGVRMGAREL